MKERIITADKLRVYTSPSAFPNPQRLRLFALEKGIEDELEKVVYDMTPDGDQRESPHLKMDLWGETTTLELADGSFLAETAEIVRYLDLAYPGRKITGGTLLQQGQDAASSWSLLIITPHGASTAVRRRSPTPPS